jgi:predicted HNH restriction endonuclease
MPRELELEKLRKQFVNDFNMNKLMNMTKEEYVVGLGRKDSFCYRLETELQDLGNIHGATSAKFGLYYGKSGDDKEEKYRCTKKFGDNPDDALKEIKKQIVYLRMDGEKKNLDAIRKCELAPLFRGKILAVFFPEDFLCIFADEHLDYFMQKLGITIVSNDDTLTKQLKLVEWKNNRPEMKDWNNHLFSNFLYSSFGRPFEDEKSEKDIQTEKDKAYPKEYVTKVGITIGQWKELLQNPDVFKPEDITLLMRFYRSENHAATCYDLGIQDGISPSAYITPIVSLAKRIAVALDLDPIYGDDGKQVWWRIPFWGRYREDGKFEWKLRPELAKAMAAVYPELLNTANKEVEEQEDNGLIEELKQANVTTENFEYSGVPKLKTAPVYTNGHKTYPRDRQVAINALAHAGYECEVDSTHPTFIRKKSDKKYTEPHHLVPMAFSDEFEVSLDVEENIVSLCSNCHNQIHYGKDANVLIKHLYEERKAVLESVGIKITLGRLLSMYGYGENSDNDYC